VVVVVAAVVEVQQAFAHGFRGLASVVGLRVVG